MSTNKTKNLNLHAWEPTDAVSRVEFNENFAALDENAGKTWAEVATLTAATPRIAAGTYTGDGNESQFISLGFTPKAVFVCTQEGRINNLGSGNSVATSFGGLALAGNPVICGNGVRLIEIGEGGFTVRYKYDADHGYCCYANYSTTFYYVAIG